jgi:hypothetical protein
MSISIEGATARRAFLLRLPWRLLRAFMFLPAIILWIIKLPIDALGDNMDTLDRWKRRKP